MKYEFDVLAALVQFQHPTTKTIAQATGISERKVQIVFNDLRATMGLEIKKHKDNARPYFTIISWGAFESGQDLIQRLKKVDLITIKYQRLAQRQDRKRIISDSCKKNYSDTVKARNYQDSLRLEGIEPVASLPTEPQQRKARKEELLSKYQKRERSQHGG